MTDKETPPMAESKTTPESALDALKAARDAFAALYAANTEQTEYLAVLGQIQNAIQQAQNAATRRT